MGGLETRGVAKTYESKRGPVVATEPISFSLEKGETIAIVGPSGCGKSTLLRVASGLEAPSTGEVLVDGAPVSGPVKDLGYVFQKDLLLEWRSVLNNVMLPVDMTKDRRKRKDELKERALLLLRQLELEEFAERHPWELSGGMRQRVGIARALLLEPSLLFLDEPFSALDALTRDQMNVTLQDIALSGNCSTLLITHSIPEAIFVADRVLVMSPRPGRILKEIVVPFPRPRRLEVRETKEFTEIVSQIREEFERAGVFK